MVEWAIKAAELGSLDAICGIASGYRIMDNLQDYAKLLFPWLLRAAEEGHRDSMYEISSAMKIELA